jgi:hypothetical protein
MLVELRVGEQRLRAAWPFRDENTRQVEKRRPSHDDNPR